MKFINFLENSSINFTGNALFVAVKKNKYDVVKILLEHEADGNATFSKLIHPNFMVNILV